jgi:hypothetical protein
VDFKCGGVQNGPIPNFIYRWTPFYVVLAEPFLRGFLVGKDFGLSFQREVRVTETDHFHNCRPIP